MASKKSTIPPKAQVPVAVGLAVLFAVILAWRFLSQDEGDAPAVPAAPSGDSEVQVSLEELTEALEALQEGYVKELPRPSELPPLARNPFLVGEAGVRPAALEAGGKEAVARQLALAGREAGLAGLVLSATCVAGESSGAIVNGRHLGLGDEIEGLTIQKIEQRQVVLTDDWGTYTIEIQEPAWLLDEAGRDLAPAQKEANG